MNISKIFFILILIYSNLASCHLKKIYIHAGSWGDLFHREDHDNRLEPVRELKKKLLSKGYDLIQVTSFDKNFNDAELILTFDIPIGEIYQIKKYNKSKLVAFLWESPIFKPFNYIKKFHEYFSKIYTWKDNLIDNKKYFKLYYPALQPMIKDITDFNHKKLCTLVSGNKIFKHPSELYSERLKIINFFECIEKNDFDFYGTNWPVNIYKNYKGEIFEKVNILKKYKFCICYESTKNEFGYITEKIFDCFQAGCIPIYWGAKNIAKYIPKNCFIAREQFKNDFELYEFMKNMHQEKYNKYIQNIKKFLLSKRAYLFSTDNFIKIFLTIFNKK